jgi:Cellulose biosynthesis protein BcsS
MPGSRIGPTALAAAVVFCAFPGNRSDAQEAVDATERLLLFSGAEIALASRFAYGGFVWSPGGINAEGLAMKALAGAGMYRYRSGAQEITGDQLLVSLLPGWRFKQETFETTCSQAWTCSPIACTPTILEIGLLETRPACALPANIGGNP